MDLSSSLPFVDLKAQYAACKEAIDRRIQTVLDHGRYILGPEVQELEQRLAGFVGSRHCVTVASGTDALRIALMALDIGPGDEVITSPFSFIATAEAIVSSGACPVFADIEPHACQLDPSAVEAQITPRTRALIPVSLYGQPCDMAAFQDIARRHGLFLIEDGAQSFGACYGEQRSGRLSDVGCTSFFPSKPLGCYGDGGALFTEDDAVAAAARSLQVHGRADEHRYARIGINSRMDTLQCAVVLAKLDRFEWEVARRLELGARYDALCDAAGIARIRVCEGRTSVFAQYTVFVESRDEVRQRLMQAGIPTAVHYPVPIHRQPAYRAYARQAYPQAEHAAARVLSLPMHPYLSEATQRHIIASLLEASP